MHTGVGVCSPNRCWFTADVNQCTDDIPQSVADMPSCVTNIPYDLACAPPHLRKHVVSGNVNGAIINNLNLVDKCQAIILHFV